MTKERKIEILKDLLIQLSDSANILCTCEADERCEVVEEYIKALEQQSEDCVSRKRVKNRAILLWNGSGDEDYKFDTLIDYITDLPSVTPTFPKDSTNGDVIKAMFPRMEIIDENNTVKIRLDPTRSNTIITTNYNWLGASYRR